MASYLSFWDYVVFAAILLVSALIGVYYRFSGGRQKTVQEYMLANGSMSFLPVAFSLMASFMSAITILGVSSENYMYGTQFVVINIAYVIGTPIVAYVYLPVFYRLKALSVYEYLEHRFGKTTRLVASAAFSLQMILYMGIVLYAPSLALSAVTGLNKVGAILSVGLVCTFYSTIGGMKAVLITDVFQSLLMFAAVYCVIIKGAIDLGGVGNIWSIAEEGQRIEFFNFSLDPTVRHTVFTQIIGGMFVFLSLYAVNQAQVQRLLTVRDLKGARLSLWWSLPILMFLSLSTSFAGLTIYAKYRDCDPILTKRICSADQLLPLFVVDSLENIPGLTGLFIAGLLSGSLSTVSSAINSLAAVTWEDYMHPLLKAKRPKPVTVSLINKLLAFMFGLACIGLAFVAENFTGVLQASLTIFGVVGGPLMGLFTLGMIFPFTSQKAVVPSFLVALALGLWIGFGGPKPPVARLSGGTSCPAGNVTETMTCKGSSSSTKPPEEYFYLYRLSYQWYTLIGFSITIILGNILSLWYPQESKVDENLLSPVLGRILKRFSPLQDREQLQSNQESLGPRMRTLSNDSLTGSTKRKILYGSMEQNKTGDNTDDNTKCDNNNPPNMKGNSMESEGLCAEEIDIKVGNEIDSADNSPSFARKEGETDSVTVLYPVKQVLN